MRLSAIQASCAFRMHAGTYDWQAPETLLGGRTTFSADVFSFGVICLELITGERQVRGRYDRPL